MIASTENRFPHAARLSRAVWLILAVGILLGGCHGRWFANVDAAGARNRVRHFSNIEFDPRRELSLDLYAPINAHDAPVVVFFYGGSWLGGERDWFRFVGDALAAHGVITVIPDYRKLPDVDLGGFMRDAARAVAWTHEHVADHGGDPQRLFVMGHSSGGHIAALLATDPRWLAAQGLMPRTLAGCIGLAGIYAFLPADEDDEEMLDVFGNAPDQWHQAAPVAFVHGAEPPMLLLSGDDDDEVDPENSRRLAAALQAHGEAVTLHIYPKIGHSALLLALAHPRDPRAPVLRDILAFIHSQPATTDIASPP